MALSGNRASGLIAWVGSLCTVPGERSHGDAQSRNGVVQTTYRRPIYQHQHGSQAPTATSAWSAPNENHSTPQRKADDIIWIGNWFGLFGLENPKKLELQDRILVFLGISFVVLFIIQVKFNLTY